MSTSNRAGAVEQPARRMRPAVFWTGLALWSLVLVGGVLVAWPGASRNATVGDAAVAIPRLDTDLAPAATGENPSGISDQRVATLPVNDPTRAGEVIDLSTLMNKAVAPDAPLWDPAGVEDFTLINADGRTVTKQDLLGRPWAICFVFTKCLGPCPTVTRQLREVQDRLEGYDFHLVTLTVDPARDTPEVLAKYAKLNGADPEKWFFLTGDQIDIYGLIHRSFKMPVQEVTGPDRKEGFEVIHSTNVMLVDAQGVVRGKFNAAKDSEMAELRRQLKDLSSELPVATATPAETPVADGRQ